MTSVRRRGDDEGAEPPSGSSRVSATGAGWSCAEPGSFLELVPATAPRFSWLRPSVLWRSRNDVLARMLGNPTNEVRRLWVEAQRERGATPDVPIDRTALKEFSFLLLADTGEGDQSQYAVVPSVLEVGDGTAFMVICGDVVYPTGSVNEYPDKFFRPYQRYPAPVFAVPGNHDWYDGLGGFMRVFCDARVVPAEVRPRPFTKAWLRRWLWAAPSVADEPALAAGQALRAQPGQQATQPGPYWVMDTGPVRLVGIDVGITGELDAEQGAWLRRVSAGPRPKILLTGVPIYDNNTYQPCPIDGGGTVDDIVRDPACGYVAVVGGDTHNYQRYPVRVGDRTIQYVVSGGGGAFMHATHTIPPVTVGGVDESEFRCYPLRGDSLSFYSQLYDRRFRAGGRLWIPPDQAVALMAERIGNVPPRAGTHPEVTTRTRRSARILSLLPVGRFFQRYFSEFSDWDDPPLFKSFLRVDADATSLRIRCFAATGCREHEADPPVEDEVTIPL
ncbi:MAG TPA: metallophosphoesterase [Cryptosporangiaceae bacterium]|nr:metallophosphoesterase [Cryptosporangiaceae bacterium]